VSAHGTADAGANQAVVPGKMSGGATDCGTGKAALGASRSGQAHQYSERGNGNWHGFHSGDS
jgi:hypothetical protein